MQYRAVPTDKKFGIKEFEGISDFDAAATVGMYAGTVTVDLERNDNGAWTHVANIPGRDPIRQTADVNPINSLTRG